MRILALAALPLLVTALTAQSPLIYSNGPLITEPHPIPPAMSSRLQSGAPPAGLNMNVLGFGAQQAAGNALADDFSVSGMMVIDAVEIFGYATNSPTQPSPVTGVFIEIRDRDPADPLSVPVPGSPTLAVNQIANTAHGWSGIYRVTTTTLNVVNRPIMSMKVTILGPTGQPQPIILPQGTYWLLFQFTGVNFSPPVTVLGDAQMTGPLNPHSNLGTAKQRVGAAGAWNQLFDTGSPVQVPPFNTKMAFNFYGLTMPQLGSITNVVPANCGLATIAVRGNPVPGGYLRSVITLSNPAGGLALTGYGFFPIVTPFCGCNFGHEWGVIVVGADLRIDIPQDPTFVGLGIRVQGVEFGGLGGCPNPPFSATDTWLFQL